MTAQIVPCSPTPQWEIDRSDERGLKDARDLLGDALVGMGLTDLNEIYVGKTIMTELVTNVIQHTATARVVVRVCVDEDGHPLIEVEDEDDRRPRIRPLTAIGDENDALAGHFESGRGLAMVEVMAEYWGWSLRAQGGKVVWAALKPVLS